MIKNKETKVFWSIFDCFSAGKQCRWPLSIQGRGLDFQLLCNCNWKKNQNREPWQVLHQHMMFRHSWWRIIWLPGYFIIYMWLCSDLHVINAINQWTISAESLQTPQSASCNQRQSQHSILRWEDHCRITLWWQTSQQWHSSDLLWDLVLFRFLNYTQKPY